MEEVIDSNYVITRWESILRSKAAEYEHTARRRGEEVSQPSLDGICNEMRAFLAGIQSK